MNDFALASNRTVTINDVEVRQVIVGELDLFLVDAMPIKKALAALEDKAPMNLIEVFLGHPEQSVRLLSMLTSLSFERITAIATDNPQQLTQLVYALYMQNSAFFDEVEVKRKGKVDDKATWFDGFQSLISQGHAHSEIMGYTYGAYLGYLKAAQRGYNRNLSALATMTRTAHHADKNDMERFFRSLAG